MKNQLGPLLFCIALLLLLLTLPAGLGCVTPGESSESYSYSSSYYELDGDADPVEGDVEDCGDGRTAVLSVNDSGTGGEVNYYEEDCTDGNLDGECDCQDPEDECEYSRQTLPTGPSPFSCGVDCNPVTGNPMPWCKDGGDMTVWDCDRDQGCQEQVITSGIDGSMHCEQGENSYECGGYDASGTYTSYCQEDPGSWGQCGEFSGVDADVLWDAIYGAVKNNFVTLPGGGRCLFHERVFAGVTFPGVTCQDAAGQITSAAVIDRQDGTPTFNPFILNEMERLDNGDVVVLWYKRSSFLPSARITLLNPATGEYDTQILQQYSVEPLSIPSLGLTLLPGDRIVAIYPNRDFTGFKASVFNRFLICLRTFELNREIGRPVGAVSSAEWGSAASVVGVFSGSLDLVRLNIRRASLNFAQFGDGSGLFSQIVLNNPDPQMAATVQIIFKKQDGTPLKLDRDGEQLTVPGSQIEGTLEIVIPPGGRANFRTDGAGDVVAGSVRVRSDKPISGVIIFGGALGLAGVGSSELLTNGFSAPMETSTAESINTGIAVMNLDREAVTLTVRLCDADGQVLATAQAVLTGMGQTALFVNQFNWDQAPDFTQFQGTLKVQAAGRIAATVVQTRGAQFATMPVDPS